VARVYDSKLSTAVIAEFQILAPCSRTEETAIEHWRLSKARLSRIHDVMARYVDEVPGLVTLVSRQSKVHVKRYQITLAALLCTRQCFTTHSCDR
jgi:hypothetical protein